MRTPGFFRTFGHHFGHRLANELLDKFFPPKPTFAERFMKELPGVLTMAVYVVDRFAQKPPPEVPVSAAIPSIPRPAPPPCKVLGEFTCPQCKGHTWGWTGEDGRDENGTYIRACTGQWLPCRFTWKATEDHLYFAPPTAEHIRYQRAAGAVAPPSVASEDDAAHVAVDDSAEAVQVAISKEWPRETPPPIDVLRIDLASLRSVVGKRIGPQETIVGAAVKLLRKRGVLIDDPIAGTTAEQVETAFDAVAKAVGDRRDKDESTMAAAARLLAEADAYIAKQAEQIRGLMLDNEFGVNSGEFSTVLTADQASAIGLPNYACQPVAVVVNDGRWSVRVGAALYSMGKQLPDCQPPALSTAELADYLLHALKRKAADRAPVLTGHRLHGGVVDGPVEVGCRTAITPDEQIRVMQENAAKNGIGTKLAIPDESKEIAAYLDDEDKKRAHRDEETERYSRQWHAWQEEKRNAEESKNDETDMTDMAQNAAGGVA